MKKLLCALLSCALCTASAAGMTGCGCSNSKEIHNQQPGYVVEPTEPDLKDGDFGYFIINNSELMLTEYTGSDTDVVIPQTYNNYTITVVGRSVFNDAEIASVVMPDTITEVQDYAFSSCKKLTNVKFSANTKIFGSCVFFNCPNLKQIELPDSITYLGSHTFSATGLESVTIPKSNYLTEIDEFVFYQCQNLKEVTIPETITNIKDNSFSDCPNKITIKAPNGSFAQSYANNHGFDYIPTN